MRRLEMMRYVSTRVAALAAVGVLALLVLVVVSIVQAHYDLLLVALAGGAGIGLALLIHQKQAAHAAQLRKLATKVDRLTHLARGIPRLEDTVTSSPRMLEGSQERQIAETAARFDWLARRQSEEAERLDAFAGSLEATLTRRHEQILALLQAGDSSTDPRPDAREKTTGSPL
jgi:hypothetical protein